MGVYDSIRDKLSIKMTVVSHRRDDKSPLLSRLQIPVAPQSAHDSHRASQIEFDARMDEEGRVKREE